MSPDDLDGWHSNMIDVQADLVKRAVAEVNRLRTRVRELEAQVAAQPATAWALQERVTQLEGVLRISSGNPGVSASPGEPISRKVL